MLGRQRLPAILKDQIAGEYRLVPFPVRVSASGIRHDPMLVAELATCCVWQHRWAADPGVMPDRSVEKPGAGGQVGWVSSWSRTWAHWSGWVELGRAHGLIAGTGRPEAELGDR